MNRHWGIRLGDVAQFIRGLTYKPGDVLEANDAGAVPCMRTKNIQQQLEDDDLVYVPDRLVRNGRWLEEGDILVSSANSWNLVGKCSWVPRLGYRATFGGFTSVLRADPRSIDARYLYHWFSWDHTQTVVRSFGQQTTNISNLNQNRCLDLALQLPALDEQRRIAAILDTADALRQKRKRAIALLDSLTQSIFLEMFGEVKADWPIMTIDQVGQNIRTGPFGSQLLHSEFVDEGIAVLGIDNVVQNTFAWGKPRFITNEKYRALSRYKVHPGDVLITIMGTIGRCVVVPDDVGDAINTKHLCCITPNKELVVSEYLKACFLGHPDVLRQLGQQSKGAIMDGLNMGLIKGLAIPVPPTADQQRFARAIHAVTDRLRSANASCENAQSLFASLQHRAFSGQL